MIAAINGACAGIGLVQALVCDVRFMARGAKVSTAYAKLGIPAEYGMSWILPGSSEWNGHSTSCCRRARSKPTRP